MAEYIQDMTRREFGDVPAFPGHMRMGPFLVDIGVFEEDWSDELTRVQQQASKEVVNSLPEKVIDGEGKLCSICLLDFKKKDTVKEMPCLHIFHPLCLITWLNQNNTCPFCRHRLPIKLNRLP